PIFRDSLTSSFLILSFVSSVPSSPPSPPSFPTRRSSDLSAVPARTRYRHGVPELCALSAYDRAGEHGVRAQDRHVLPHGHMRIEDRKSTRLNSSHVSNSYAVFCLKKKNTTNTSCV